MRSRRATQNSRDQAMFGAAIRLALLLSCFAALTALGLEALGDVSRVRLVVTVALIGFVSSWVMTGRVQRRPLTLTSSR